MTVEQRLDQLEKRNKRLTVALTMTVVAMAAVVTMAATGEKDGRFDTVVARTIFVTNDAGQIIVGLNATDNGNGLVYTMSAKGKDLVTLTATDTGGLVEVYNKTGEGIIQMGADDYGNGLVGAYNRKGKGRTLQPGP
jgi:hypothetical protein